MYINTIFILYSIALLVSLVCLVFIALIFVRKKDRGNEVYIAARRFAVIVMMTDILYFIFYYREVVQNKYALAFPFRIVDYVLCISVFLCWILILNRLASSKPHKVAIKLGLALCGVRLVASVFITSFYMGSYYSIENPLVRQAWTSLEIIFIVLTDIIITYSTIRVIMENISSTRKQYAIVCTALLLIWSMCQGIVDVGLFSGKYGMSAWLLETPDFTGATFFFINLATCIFVFKEDFSPLFLSENDSHNNNTRDSLDSKLDAIASNHKLTVREREIMALIYQGMTNPDISEELFISINTVKKHTHNLFEKLDVTNRMEVVYMINSWKNTKSSK